MRVSFIIVDVESLHEPLCHKPHFVSYHMTVFITLLEEDPFASYRDDFWRCSDCKPKNLSLVKRAILPQLLLSIYPNQSASGTLSWTFVLDQDPLRQQFLR